jgi:hypothetical protein
MVNDIESKIDMWLNVLEEKPFVMASQNSFVDALQEKKSRILRKTWIIFSLLPSYMTIYKIEMCVEFSDKYWHLPFIYIK